jgi:hypothetical protein
LTPEDFFASFSFQWVEFRICLVLVQFQLVADIHRKGTVAQHTPIIALGHAVQLCQDETLQAADGSFPGERIEGGSPILLKESRVLVGSRLPNQLVF